MADRTVKVRLEAIVGPYQRAMAEAAHATRQASGELAKLGHTSQKTAHELQPLGTAMLGVGAAFAAGTALSVHAAIEFEAAMRNVNSIMGESEGQFARTSDAVRELSRDLPQSATNLAQGLYDIASSGFQGAAGLEVLEQSATAATAGLSDTATASSAIVGALNAYGLSAADAAEVSDILFATVDKGVISFPELAQGMGEWVGTAHAAGISLDEAAAALATMTVNGIQAFEAHTSLNRVILSFISPSEAMAAALKQIGFQSGAAALQSVGLQGVMEKLADAGFDNVTALQALFPEVRGLRGALALTANEGEKFAAIAGEITDEVQRAGATQRAFEEQSKSTAVQIALLRNNLTDLAIEFGQALLPVIRLAVEVLGDLLDGFREMPAPLQTMVAGGTILFGVVTLLGGGFLFLLPRIQATQAALATLAVEAPAVATALRSITIATGAVGAALTVVTAAYALFAANQDNAADSTNHMAQAVEAFAKGQRDVAIRLTVLDFSEKGVLDTLQRVGLATEAVNLVVGDSAETTDAWYAALHRAVAAGKLSEDEANKLSRTVNGLSLAYSDAAVSAREVDATTGQFGVTADETGAAVDGLGDELADLNKVVDEYLGKVLGLVDASDAWQSSLIDLATQLRDNTDEFGHAGASLQGFSDAALDNRDAMGQAVKNAAAWVEKMVEQDKSQQEIGAGLAQMAADLIATATAYGVPIEQARVYANMILGIPTSVDTKVSIDAGGAIQTLDQVLSKLNEISAISADIGPIVATLVGGSPQQFARPPAGGTAATPRPTSGGSGGKSGADYLEGLWRQRMEQVENRFHAGEATLDEYEKSLDEQLAREVPWTNAWVALQQKKADAVKYWTDAAESYLKAL